MLSLEQIKSVTFDKAVRGYRPEDVDDFIAQIATQLEKLIEEKQGLENKLYVLAESVEKYRGDEDALKSALINAQKLGESVISEANKKAEEIIRESKAKADREYTKVLEDVNLEYARLNKMQQEVTRFRSTILAAYKAHIELLSDLPHDEESQEVKPEETVVKNDMEPLPVPVVADAPEVIETAETTEGTTVVPAVVAPVNTEIATSIFDINKDDYLPEVTLADQIGNEKSATTSFTFGEPTTTYPATPQSEINPIIPMMDDYEKQQSERNAAEQGQGRISLFNHYSDYETDDE